MASRDWGPYHGLSWDLPDDPFDITVWLPALAVIDQWSIYTFAGAATEEEYYSERVVVRPEAIPNPDYNGAPWVAPYSGYRYIRVTPEVLKDSRSPNLANEINSRLLSNLDREFWYGVIDTCNPDDHPSIVRGGLWE